MKIDPVLSQILRHKWAIDPEYAFLQAPVINGLLEGNMIDRSLMDNHIPGAVMGSGKTVSYYNWSEAPKGSVALIHIKGELMKSNQSCGPVGMEALGKRVKEANEDPRFVGILLKVDSPGGTVDGTEVFASIVKNSTKPVLTYVDGLMASAAAWIGTGANEIWASTDTDEIGSIGVLMSFADLQPYYERMGVKFHVVTASTSEEKVKMYEDLRAGKYKEYQEKVLDVLDAKFMATVKQNRPNVTQEHLSGKVFFAKDVLGTLIDQIGTFDAAVERLYELSKTSSFAKVSSEDEANDNVEFTLNANKKMEKLVLLMAAMGVGSIELDKDGFAALSEEQLTAIEAALQNAADAQATLEDELKTANAAIDDSKSANSEQIQEIATLKETNKTLQLENESLKKAAAGGSTQAITDNDTATEDVDASKNDGVVTSDANDFMTNLNALAAERKAMGL
jgi:protease-4